MVSHVRRSITPRAGAPHHFSTRIQTGVVTDSGEDRYFYLESRAEREPIFLVDSVRTHILSKERLSAAPIRVVKPDGSPVKSDLIAVRFYFWNDGKEPIKRQNILRPITVTLNDNKSEILDFKALHVSREISGFTLKRNSVLPTRSLLIDVDILEQHDGATGQVIYEGDPKAEFEITGIIEGVKHIQTNTTISTKKLWLEYFKWWVSVVLAIMIMGGLFGVLVLLAYVKKVISGRFSKLPISETPLKLASKVGTWLGRLALLSIAALVIFAFITGPWKQAKSKFQEQVTQQVPEQVLPK